MAEQNKDTLLLPLLITTIIFVGLLIYVDFFYSDWAFMFDTWWHLAGIVAIIGNAVTVVLGVIVWSNWRYGDWDANRKWFLAIALATAVFICAYRASSGSFKQVIIDSNNAKQEQTK